MVRSGPKPRCHGPRKPHREPLKGSWPIAAATVGGIGVLAGVLASVLPTVITIGLSLCGLFVLGLTVIRRQSAAGRESSSAVPAESQELAEPPSSVESIELRTARALFYVGVLTLGESAFRPRFGLTISEIAFILSFGLCVFAVARGARISRLPIPIVVAVGIFVFGAAVSSLRAQSPPLSAVGVLHAIYVLLLWPWVGAMVIKSRRHLLTAFGLWAISGAVDGVGALGQVLGLHLPGTPPVQVGSRYTGFTVHANDLGGVVAIALVPSLIFALRGARGRSPAWLKWVVVSLVAVALVLSGSIASISGAFLALVVWLTCPALRPQARVVAAFVALCAIGTVIAASHRITSPIQRITQVTNAAGSAQARISTTQAAWQQIKRSPVVGKGLDPADTAVVIVLDGFTTPYLVHGLPVAAWYEAGLFGLVGLLGLLASLIFLGWNCVRRSRSPDDQLISWGLLAALAPFLFEVMTEQLAFQGYDWMVPTLLVAWSVALAGSARTTDARVQNRYRPKLLLPRTSGEGLRAG